MYCNFFYNVLTNIYFHSREQPFHNLGGGGWLDDLKTKYTGSVFGLKKLFGLACVLKTKY